MEIRSSIYVLIFLCFLPGLSFSQRLSAKLMEKNGNWYCAIGINNIQIHDADNSFEFYSSERLLKSYHPNVCPYYVWNFQSGKLFYVSEDPGCEGRNKGILFQVFRVSAFKIMKIAGWDCLVIRLNDALNIYQIEKLERLGKNEYILRLKEKSRWKSPATDAPTR